MKCFYINLDRATARRETIESSFSRFGAPNWSLHRFAALDVNHVARHKIQGTISDAEKACFLSHRTVVRNNCNETDHILVLEDDAMFGPNTFSLIDNFCAAKAASLQWDLLFTDVGITAIGAMSELVKLRRDLMAKRSIECFDLKTIPFFAATAYIINAQSLKKVAGMMLDAPLNIPYDLYLRKLIYEGKLSAFMTFPFLTTVSDEAVNSSIQSSEFAKTDLLWNLFRRMTWIEGDSFDPTQLLNEMWGRLDRSSQRYGALWAAMSDPSFKPK